MYVPKTTIQSPPRRHRRGQTAVEFALTLPILLLLMFGIIEFGRIFQSWVTIQNAARTAARYAITGQYDQTLFTDINNNAWQNAGGVNDLFPSDGSPATDLSHGVPCPLNSSPVNYTSGPIDGSSDAHLYSAGNNATSDQFFKSHWSGTTCDPTNELHLGLQKDVLRLVSMTKAAQLGSAGLQISKTINIPGTGINTDAGAGWTVPNQGGSMFSYVVRVHNYPTTRTQILRKLDIPRTAMSIGKIAAAPFRNRTPQRG